MTHEIRTKAMPRTQALILAGGQGERLLPLTVKRPKPAIPFGGIFRIIDFTLSNCLHSRLKHVALLTQYRHEELHSYIRKGWSALWDHSRRLAEPLRCLPPTSGKSYRGTADAIFQNLRLFDSDRPEHVLVLSGDHVYHMDYREMIAQHTEMNADLTIATIEHPLKHASHFGVIEVEKDFRVIGFEEKPPKPRSMPLRADRALISMGVYVFKTDVLIQSLRENCGERFGYDFGRHIIPSLIGSSRVYAYDFRDDLQDTPRYWRDIGTIDSYYEANMDLVQQEPGFNPYISDYDSTPMSRHAFPGGYNDRWPLNTRVHTDCHVSQSILSPGVRVEERANVQDSVLMPGVQVGPGAVIRRAIIEEGVKIPADFRIGWDSDEDRKHFLVSPTGVVVVNEIPKLQAIRVVA